MTDMTGTSVVKGKEDLLFAEKGGVSSSDADVQTYLQNLEKFSKIMVW